MRTYLRISSRTALTAAGALAIALGVVTVPAGADIWDKKTVLTVNQPVQVQETYLDPGTYVFKLLDSGSNRHIVQIYNRDQDHLINTILAMPNYRLAPSGDSRFTFYETPPGTARAMRAWFYPGDSFGQEFRHPKQLRQIALASTPGLTSQPEPPPMASQPAEPEPESSPPQVESTPSDSDEPEAVVSDSGEPEPIAQEEAPPPNVEDPAPAAEPTAEQEPADKPDPTTLPKTATPFPLIGLGGLLSFGAYCMVRRSCLK